MSGQAEIRYHPGVASRDLPWIIEQLGPGSGLREFILQMNLAIAEALGSRGTPAAQLRPPLSGWYRKKFHSRSLPPTGASADARLIYRLDKSAGALDILAVGLRRPGSPDDVYSTAAARLVHEG